MKIIGIPAEYNPFHNGHVFQIKKIKNHFPDSAVIVAMSGNAVQRGSFAVADKWIRAKTALENGVDLVFELPYCFAGQTAERFAFGAVSLLNHAGCEALSFGVEKIDITGMTKIARILTEEPASYRNALRHFLNDGEGFASARQKAVAELTSENTARLLESPNNILAVEYIKAILSLGLSMALFPIQREGAAHHETMICNSYSSASAIRQALLERRNIDAVKVLPYPADILDGQKYQKSLEYYEDLILSKMLTADSKTLKIFPDIAEGLEFALLNAVKYKHRLEDILEETCSRRIPKSRVRRILMNICMNFKCSDFEELSLAPPAYLRVLAFNGKGRALLRQLSKKSSLPLITNLHSNQTRLDESGRRSLMFDCRSTDLFYLLRGEKNKIHADYQRHPVFMEEPL